jgi:lipid II:glycine glycyltransferase (peptidoglycan interpeptide bridge formation enzyme)
VLDGGDEECLPLSGSKWPGVRGVRSRLGGWGGLDGVGGNLGRNAVAVTVRLRPDTEELSAWDRLVNRTPGTDVTQFSGWARLRRQVGFASLYLLAHQAGELVGGAQLMTRHIPVLGTLGYLPYGPLVAPDTPVADDVRYALADALAMLGRRRLRMLFVQPPEGEQDLTRELLRRGFRPSSADIAPRGSIRIDLTADLAEIRGRFGKSLKSWTNKWKSRNVTVRVGDEKDVPLLAALMAVSSARQGYRCLPVDYIRTLYRELAPTEHAAIFVGEVHSVPVAAALVTRCGDMVRGRLSGFDRREDSIRLSVPAAIRWEILQWAKARGYRWFDFGGLRPETLDALLDNDRRGGGTSLLADQPKVTFGGTAYRYPDPVEMIRPAPLRVAYDLATHSAAGRRLSATAQRMFRGQRRYPQQSETPASGPRRSGGTPK